MEHWNAGVVLALGQVLEGVTAIGGLGVTLNTLVTLEASTLQPLFLQDSPTLTSCSGPPSTAEGRLAMAWRGRGASYHHPHLLE